MSDTTPQDRSWPWILVASAVLPMLLYTLTAAPGPYWLDSGELAAAGYLAGTPHPPGHPLFVAFSNPAGLGPFGSVALRMNLSSALAMSLSMALLALVARRILCHIGTRPRSASIAAGLAALTTATSYALWFQAVRAEVYALHLLCAASILALAVEMELRASRGDPADARLLMAMGFITGLALANHHYLVIFIGIPVVALILIRRIWRKTLFSAAGLKACGFGLFGLCTYALLPLRAARDPFVNYGDPDNLSDFWWVITAQAFQKSLERAQQVDVIKLLMDLGGQMGRQLTPMGLVFALAGAVWLLKGAERRGIGLLLIAVVGFNLITQSLMNFDPFNPDVHGYFALSVWTLGLLLALCWGSLDRVSEHIVETQSAAQGRVARVLPALGLVAFTLLGAFNLHNTLPYARLDGFHDVELTTMAMLEPLPEGAIVLTSSYKTVFSLWAAQSIEHRRPDVLVIHRNFLPTPSYAREVRTRHPKLADLILTQDDKGRTTLDFGATRDLSAQRPIYMEYDVNIKSSVAPYLIPEGLLMRLVPQAQRGPLDPRIVERQSNLWVALEDRMGVHSDRGLELETRRYLMWIHYLTCRALLDAEHHTLARFHLDRAMAINPLSPELWALAGRLGIKTPPPVPLPAKQRGGTLPR